jgi:dihydrodiol dehydrogenase / D-xylose 1-dehydrogenase (NADP)
MKPKKDAIRWGIVATGGIAHLFAKACAFESKRTGKSALYAVASRDQAKADSFARKWGIPQAYDSYEKLFADPDVDVVYIATPHSSHVELSLAALRAGKAVLCEKAVSLTADGFRPVIDLAREKGLFFMEAMWMRFNPSFQKALSWIAEGAIGAPRYVKVDFFLDRKPDPTSRLFAPELGGGAILDLGVYTATCAVSVAGKVKPKSISSFVRTDDKGVDYWNKAILSWDSGLKADLACALDLKELEETRSAVILGETGSIILPYFWMAEQAILFDDKGRKKETFRAPFKCNGYEYEIREVERCISCSLTESPVQTWADSIMVMEILDSIRMVAKNE